MKRLLYLFLLTALAACTTDTYDSGDGRLSYLRADFVMAHTATARQIDYALSDEGRHISLSKPLAASWALTPDSLYRALLYYNDRPTGCDPLALQQVYVLWPRPETDVETPKTDPVNFESSWLSDDGQWLNVAFYVKTGRTDDTEALQAIGMMTQPSATGDTLTLTLLHDQAGIPQYYSTRVYTSVPLTSLAADARPATLRLVVDTYDGTTCRLFNLP